MMIPEVEYAKNTIRSVVQFLGEHDNDGWADYLRDLLQEMKGWLATKEAFFTVGPICHPRALRDAILWTDPDRGRFDLLVDEMESACATAFNSLERLPEHLRTKS